MTDGQRQNFEIKIKKKYSTYFCVITTNYKCLRASFILMEILLKKAKNKQPREMKKNYIYILEKEGEQ